MTRTLRRRHRGAVMLLAVVLPVGVAIALAARPTPALVANAALAAATAADAPLTVAWQANAGDGALHVVARVGWTDTQRDAAPALDLEVRSTVGQPELLAYWSPAAAAGDAIPAGSVLLGPAGLQATRRFRLPEQARRNAGNLILFSLAQGRSASTLVLPAADQIPGRVGGAR